MTYIEFFDSVAAENISTCLTYIPDRVIYLGDSVKKMNKQIANYEKVFKGRGYDIEFILKSISKSNLEHAIKVLSEIVETYDDCVFDITGGDEMLIMALGIVYATYPEKGIQIHKINIENSRIYDCDKDGQTIKKEPPNLSVDENINIYGGNVVYGEIDEDNTYKWELTQDFIDDVSVIWNICKKDPGIWNTFIGMLDVAEKIGKKSEDGLKTEVKKLALERELARFGAKYRVFNQILQPLIQKGLIKNFDESDETVIKIFYKNQQVKKCLTKAGQALEMKIFITAKNLTDETGEFVYNDVLNGVVIDWDGKLHDEDTEGIYDTENEVDVILMHNIVPVFISCKNGIVSADELYKLNTVAERFGGKYVKKVLVANAISAMKKSTQEYLRQRIKDMGIQLIENVHKLSERELANELKNVWCSK